MSTEILLICGCGACLIVPSVIFGVLQVVDTWRGHKAHVRLAEAGGYQLLKDESRVVSKIYGGEARGRAFAFRPSADISRSYNHEGRRSTTVHYHLQIIIPLHNQALSGLVMTQRGGIRTVPESFAEIWTVKPSAELLSIHQQNALMTFAAENAHPAGIYGSRIKFRPTMRQINLIDRSKWMQTLPAEIFPEAVAFLVYDHITANIDLQTFETLVDELTNLSIVLDDASKK